LFSLVRSQLGHVLAVGEDGVAGSLLQVFVVADLDGD
jgi:hypothetical protein